MKNLYKIKNDLYIVSIIEDVSENDYIITQDCRLVEVSYLLSKDVQGGHKVILTTNKFLIKDGVQAIDDNFLEWFCSKNGEVDFVEVSTESFCVVANSSDIDVHHHIIIPQEPKQETLEEVANEQWGNVHRAGVLGFIEGANWQAKRMYSEEDCYNTIHNLMTDIKLNELVINDDIDLKKWFEQFKKK
jgi:Icc-related predicted phosphoesterase